MMAAAEKTGIRRSLRLSAAAREMTCSKRPPTDSFPSPAGEGTASPESVAKRPRRRASGPVGATEAAGRSTRATSAARLAAPHKQSGPATGTSTESDQEGYSSGEQLPSAFDGQSEELSEFERKRLTNIQENAQFFASLNMLETAKRLQDIGKKVPRKRENIPKGEKLKSTGEQAVVRQSMRLLRLDPTGSPVPEAPIEIQVKTNEKISGPLKMVANDEGDNKVTESLMNMWLEISQGETLVEEKKPVELNEYKSSLNRMTIREGFVAKVTTKRICSLAFHPSPHRFLVAAGSTLGYVGLWDLSSQAGGVLAVSQFKPHCGTVNCLQFSPSNSAELLSLSTDGGIRCGNVAAAVFDEVYTSNTWNTSSFDFLAEDGSTLIVSHWDGDVAIVDRRTPSTSGELDAYLGINSLRTVSVHPVHRQYFVTAGAWCAAIYDVRNLKASPKKAVAQLDQHRKKVSSAYFSPVTGNQVVTTCMDDKLRVFDTSAIIPKIPLVTSVSHNNFTGRWLTKFRAVWDPKKEDCFVVGSMVRPRQINVFHSTGSKVHEFRDAEWLGSVCSINVMHPTRNILVGGNSSGRLHVFMDYSL